MVKKWEIDNVGSICTRNYKVGSISNFSQSDWFVKTEFSDWFSKEAHVITGPGPNVIGTNLGPAGPNLDVGFLSYNTQGGAGTSGLLTLNILGPNLEVTCANRKKWNKCEHFCEMRHSQITRTSLRKLDMTVWIISLKWTQRHYWSSRDLST